MSALVSGHRAAVHVIRHVICLLIYTFWRRTWRPEERSRGTFRNPQGDQGYFPLIHTWTASIYQNLQNTFSQCFKWVPGMRTGNVRSIWGVFSQGTKAMVAIMFKRISKVWNIFMIQQRGHMLQKANPPISQVFLHECCWNGNVQTVSVRIPTVFGWANWNVVIPTQFEWALCGLLVMVSW